MRASTVCLAALALMATVAGLPAQTRGPRLDVRVHVANFSINGDTIEIGYTLESRPGTPMGIGTLALATPATIVSLSAPRDTHDFETFTKHGDDPMPTWTAMGRPISPGETSPVLTLRAMGVTDLVRYFAVPDITETMKRDTIMDDAADGDRYVRWGATGVTVSIVPVPASQTMTAQAARVAGFLKRSCGPDSWIASREICASLTERLERATRAIAAGDRTLSGTHLTAFLGELDTHASRGKGVSPSAHALLKPNVIYLMRQVQAPGR